MKKNVVLMISFILTAALMFSVFAMSVSAVTLKDSRIPLAGGEFIFDDEEEENETPKSSPKTGDPAVWLVLLAGISLSAAGAVKKSRAK